MSAIDKITAYIATQPSVQRDLLWAAHALVVNFAPEIAAVWKWRTPFYTAHGDNLCYLFNDKGCVKMGFYHGAKLADPDGLLIGYEKKMIRQYAINSKADLQDDGLHTLLDIALTVNAQRTA
ncbi:MAG: DUF1801 domain-containing protein [Bacteroidota bacterium]